MHLYIHIPFCSKRCDYCDFVFFTNLKYMDLYVNFLLKEIEILYEKYKYKLDTIYFGGGTPSLLSNRHLYAIMNKINNTFGVNLSQEITIEFNPENISLEKLKFIEKLGFNRISLGIQSFSQEILNKLGRHSDVKTSLVALELLKKCDISNISLDLIYGGEGQNIENLDYSLNKIIEFSPKHISTYSLILQKGTKLYSNSVRKKILFPTEDDVADQFDLILNKLKSNNYHRYEISNFSKLNYESRHNLSYWECKNTLGIGIASVYRIDNKRYFNTYSLKKYFESIKSNNLPIMNEEIMDFESLMSEEIMMNFRMSKGIDLEKFNKKYNINFLEKYREKIKKFAYYKYLQYNNKNIYLTDLGMNISNSIISDFLE